MGFRDSLNYRFLMENSGLFAVYIEEKELILVKDGVHLYWIIIWGKEMFVSLRYLDQGILCCK